MESRISRFVLRVLTAVALVSVFGLWAMAQDDPDPNSPTPILITEATSTRALAQSADTASRVPSNKIATSQAFPPDSDIVIYVADLALMEGEGANAFRAYATDGQNHIYSFPVVGLEEVSAAKNLYAMTIRLTDDSGFWDTKPVGDVALYVTWRGLASNTARLGIGHISSDDVLTDGSKPMPLGTTNLGNRTSPPTLTRKSGRNITPDFVGYRFAADRRRFLEQATFGPTQALDDRIRRIGLKTWLAEQFAAQYPSALNPYPNQPLKPANPGPDCDGDQTLTPDVPTTCFRDTYTLYPLQTWNSFESLYGTAPLRHRVAWAMGQIWVNSGVDVQQSRHMVEYHKILSNNAFGSFRTMMGQMTLSPTMGDYLSMSLSTKNNPNENYAREIMQLFTVGLFMLNQDGSIICVEHNPCQTGDTPQPSYDQNTVNNLTKVFTGWTFCAVQASCPNVAVGALNYIDPMLLNTANHDLTAKTLTSYTGSTTSNVAACPTTGSTSCTVTTGVNATQAAANTVTYANASMNQALDNLFNHPNVGPFIGKTMIQHMVTSSPSPAYVGRVAAVFNNNGFGVRGDMKAVVRAILLDPEARGDLKTDPNYGKLREPFQFTTNFLRSFNVRSADGTTTSDGYLLGRGEYTGMGQIPFFSPTVFNYFPPGYVIPNSSLIGPEFAVMTTGTSIQRANFMNRMVFTAPAIPITADSNNGGGPRGMSVDFSDLQTLSTADSTGGQLVDELNRRMLHGTMSAQMRSTIMTAVTNIVATDTLNRARQAAYLVATSSQYQVQR